MKPKHRGTTGRKAATRKAKPQPRKSTGRRKRPGPTAIRNGKKRRATRAASGRAPQSVTQQFEKLLKTASLIPENYVLRLYVTGSTPRSSRAIQNLRALCDRHLEGRYDLEIVDIYQQPKLASGDQIIAAPTLIKKLPAPLQKVIGDLSNEEQVLMGLNLKSRQDEKTPLQPARRVVEK